jgi:hypothetical protein
MKWFTVPGFEIGGAVVFKVSGLEIVYLTLFAISVPSQFLLSTAAS